jgi:hypothetical protein
MMGTLSFDTGLKKFNINGDTSREIEFNPCDSNLLLLLKDASDEVIEICGRYGTELKQLEGSDTECDTILSKLKELEKEVRTRINGAFGSDVCSIVLGNQSALALAGGKPIIVNFISAIIAELNSNLSREAIELEQKASKYTEKYKMPTDGSVEPAVSSEQGTSTNT